jgi:hypothetical protein
MSSYFSDFMSLPQVREDSQGNVVPRSVEDEMLFRKCLPNIGQLYSIFLVMVLVEVVEGIHEHSV